MIASLISPPRWSRSFALYPLLLSRNETGDLVDYRHIQIRIDRQTKNLQRRHRCSRKVLSMGGKQATIHGEIRYQGIKIATGVDAVIFELLVKVVPANRIVGFNQDREIRIVGDFLARIFQTADTLYTLEPFAIGRIDLFASCNGLV